jgi:hypothetical protein
MAEMASTVLAARLARSATVGLANVEVGVVAAGLPAGFDEGVEEDKFGRGFGGAGVRHGIK